MLKPPDDLYNVYHQVSVHAHSNLRPPFSLTDSMNFSSSSSSSFCRTELQRALKEQAFGIQNFSITSSSSQQASALVVLLEGQRLVVQLTTRGFSVCKKSPLFTASNAYFFSQIVNFKSTKIHETIENLLQSVSPLYVKKRQEALLAALSELS